MKLLSLSNGHGEDAIALRILQELQQHPSQPKLAALPIVGEGHGFIEQGIPLLGPVKQMPSGGFIYMDGRQLARDIKGGLLRLTLTQMKAVRQWAKSGGTILAVGDIVPLLLAWWSGAPYVFVGTAKSDYYLRDEVGLLPRQSWFERLESWSGSVYLPWERWLMTRRLCKAVFPRDALTTEILKKKAVSAFYLGNPMMDNLETGMQCQKGADSQMSFVLLPGSRPPEAYDNWKLILQSITSVIASFYGRSLLFLGAIAPHLDLKPFCLALSSHGWRVEPSYDLTFTQGKATLVLSQTSFNECLNYADFAIAMAGTATEQFVGLGKPAFTIPGKGPQFTFRFAEAQTRLLGTSAILVKDPNQVGKSVQALLQNPDRLQLIAENGHRRMGEPGASRRIAECLIDLWPN